MPKIRTRPQEPTGEFVFKQPGEDPDYDAWFREQVQIGLDQIARGEVVSDEEMKRWFAERRAELLAEIEAKKPKCLD